MLNAESRKNAYIFDYTVEPPNLPEVSMSSLVATAMAFPTIHRTNACVFVISQTHYRAIFTLSNNVLVTLTMQTPESRYGEMKPTFDQMVDSFGKFEG